MSFALPIADHRRGACPTLDAPMQTGDGLLARLRVRDGRLTAAQVRTVARLADQYGNGLIEITARGNLQVRGLTTRTSAPFARAIEAAIEIERGLVVETPPLAGYDPEEIGDPRSLAAAIRTGAKPLNSRLGPKVTVVVDGVGKISLAALKADIRLTAVATDQWALSIAGQLGETLTTADAADAALRVLSDLALRGPGARATDLVTHPQRQARPTAPAPSPGGALRTQHANAVLIALPFGSVHHTALDALSHAAEFILAPHHGLIAIAPGPGFLAEAKKLGFITDPTDPRLRINACIGSAGCASGQVPARADAERLAPLLPADAHLHLSGCSKGCAHPRRADLTLVGRPDGYGLVTNGLAGDTPQAILRSDQLAAALAVGQG